MGIFKKLSNPIKAGSNVYPWEYTDTETGEVEFFSDKGKKTIDLHRSKNDKK